MARWLRLSLALVIAFAVVACGSGDVDKSTSVQSATPQAQGAATTAAPQVKGKLVIYSALDQTTIDAMVAAFKKKYPDLSIDVLGVAAAGEQSTRIRAEK